LGEQKTAKVIELLEEFRRDNPLIRNRVDQQAEDMTHPADPQRVLDAIKEIHAEAAQTSGSADSSGAVTATHASRAGRRPRTARRR